MNMWLLAATVLLVALAPLLFVLLRAPRIDALVALELTGTIVTLVLLLLAEGFGRPLYDVVAITLAVLTFFGALAYARMLERWL